MFTCVLCGNPRVIMGVCPHCGTDALPLKESDTVTVNLELGGPTTEEALNALTEHIRTASEIDIRTIIVIHGYGSSGIGGGIRRTIREALANNFFADRVDEYIHGEDLAHRASIYQDLIKRRPSLKSHFKSFKEGNPGMTILLMRH